ncbi:hypothetical protein CXZ10_07845 [Pleomorphomonas diazotrophica]|uniref:Uncharacterized protein n=1 Tax=Pleomorphomonas diazotrophica TaxID=1166257 RepID=A0A2N3LYV4_9HYPH|nr:hypothetical protein CXZ10_07845 [Pleomorphomonas diazotrophica]
MDVVRYRAPTCLQVAVDRGSSIKAMAVPLSISLEWFLFSKAFWRLQAPSPISAPYDFLLKWAA